MCLPLGLVFFITRSLIPLFLFDFGKTTGDGRGTGLGHGSNPKNNRKIDGWGSHLLKVVLVFTDSLKKESGMTEPKKLNRGGLWVPSPIGGIQFGSPSETIKDTISLPQGVPEYFVLSDHLFSAEHGISLSDIEFPVFYHLFGHKRPLKIIARPEIAQIVQQAVRESLIGPADKDLNLELDFPPGTQIPDLFREWEYFRQGPYSNGTLSMDDGLVVIPIQNERANIGGGVTLHEEEDHFRLEWDGKTDSSKIPKRVPLPEKNNIISKETSTFRPPEFGVTILGRSNGFDPDPAEKTTGFILWLGGRGLMVDPPVDSIDFLLANAIDPQLVQSVLLTHCHSDHDAGLLQRALIGPTVTVYSTPNIFASYRRKWSILSGIPEAEFDHLIHFRPVRIGEATAIENAEFIFRYTLHSIPTIAFEVHFGGLSLNYSSDTLNDPQAVEAMYQDGGIDKERREELLHFDWEHDLILHEAGIRPLHTPITTLERLPAEIRSRIHVVHATPSKHLSNEKLRIAEVGIKGTLSYDTHRSHEDALRRKLALLSQTKLFESLPIRRVLELMDITNEEVYKTGEYLIQDGDKAEKIYVVASGRASISKSGRELQVYGVGDYIGETGVFLNETRNADVRAKTDLHVLAINGERCRELCKGTPIFNQVKRHDRVRKWDAWSLFSETPLMSGVTVTQRTELESYLKPYEWAVGTPVHWKNASVRRLVLVIDGEILINTNVPETVRAGGMVGSMQDLMDDARHDAASVVKKTARVLCLDKSDFKKFLKHNPGVLVRLEPWRVEEHRKRARDVTKGFLEEYT
jgi:CRP-like cAMP-binding protein